MAAGAIVLASGLLWLGPLWSLTTAFAVLAIAFALVLLMPQALLVRLFDLVAPTYPDPPSSPTRDWPGDDGTPLT